MICLDPWDLGSDAFPIGSMYVYIFIYGIFDYIWLFFTISVGKYTNIERFGESSEMGGVPINGQK